MPISALNSFSPLVLRPPRDADKMPIRIARLKKDIIARREALEQTQAALTICCLSQRQWSWIGTVALALAFVAPFSGLVYQIVQLDSSDSESQVSTTTKVFAIFAVALALCSLCAKTTVGCISRKKAKLITPIEDEVKELKSLERMFTAMSLLSSDEEVSLETKEDRLVKCTQKIQSRRLTWISDKCKHKWVNMLVKKLPDASEIKQLMNQGNVLTEACVAKGDAVKQIPEEISIKIEDSSSQSASGNPVRLFEKVRNKIHRGGVAKEYPHTWDQVAMVTAPSGSMSLGSSDKSFSLSAASLSDHTNVVESSPYGSHSSPPSRGGQEDSTPSRGNSHSSEEENSENISPKMEQTGPFKDLPANLKERKEKLRGIAEKLHEKLGLTEFYNPVMKVYFDIHGNVIRKES